MEYKYELVQTDTSFPLKIIVHSSNEPANISAHWHDSVEISYVLSGMIDHIYVDGANYRSQAGDIVLINSNAIHSFSLSKAEGEERKAVTVLIPYEFIKENDPGNGLISFDCISIWEANEQRLRHFAELRELLNDLVAAYLNRDQDLFAPIHLTALSYKLLYVLFKYFKKTNAFVPVIDSRKYSERLSLIMGYIKANYDQNLSLNAIAEVLGLSSEYLARFFVKHTGVTLFQYINAIRLERAFRDLMSTDQPVIQIALHHGFPNEKSFTRVFRQVFQTTPHQYRKENKTHAK
ncbi:MULTISPECIES: AraC family transcriptional regulator [Paenibacillus]|uniref:AraC family transcriptional regulator n=1 Tax=Paenibacillus TaxID=44249 RepID=UPI00242AE704|nr:AraC family transcriptional regulator [Paenibacillus macerans]MBS5910344.1 helix-turn-helix transcriptional regulator [Paenibacillus macerans]MEC0331146.1 AraC family transcriptional regulator [Paenibacillus macerans]